MNTLLDRLESDHEHLSPHINTSDRGWWVAGIAVATVIVLWFALAAIAGATPTTTYWAPSTASCQARGVPHVTYDTYFWKGPAAGTAGARNYPIDTGLTVGVLPTARLRPRQVSTCCSRARTRCCSTRSSAYLRRRFSAARLPSASASTTGASRRT